MEQNKLNINQQTFCISPWTEVRINSDGTMNFCHFADRADLPSNEHINSMTVDEYFSNSDSAQSARKNILNGKPVDRCHRCYKEDQHSEVTFRSRRNLQAAIFPGQDFQQSAEESPVWKIINADKSSPRFYHISFSNICNMACVMCDGFNSTLLAADLNKIGLRDSSIPIKHDWTDTPTWGKFCDHLLNNNDIVCLHVMGGEPLYHKRFRDLIMFLCNNNHTNFHLTFVTNGTIYDPELMTQLEKFKSVQIEISIENLDISNDYIRYPGKTSKIVDNIQQYLAHSDEKFSTVLRTVPQLLSLMHYDKLLDFCLEHSIIIDSNVLHRPEFFRPCYLPNSAKEVIKSRLARFILKDKDVLHNINVRNQSRVVESISHHAQMIIGLLDQTGVNIETVRQELTDYCAKFDQLREHDLREFVPELAEFLDEYGYAKKRYQN